MPSWCHCNPRILIILIGCYSMGRDILLTVRFIVPKYDPAQYKEQHAGFGRHFWALHVTPMKIRLT